MANLKLSLVLTLAVIVVNVVQISARYVDTVDAAVGKPENVNWPENYNPLPNISEDDSKSDLEEDNQNKPVPAENIVWSGIQSAAQTVAKDAKIIGKTFGRKTGIIAKADDDDDDDKGWSVTTWALVIAGGILLVIILSCVIASLFCACVKEILCLPITILTKCCKCCCKCCS